MLTLAVFNHLLGQQPELRAELARWHGRRVAVALAPFTVAGVVTDEGYLARCPGEPEATVRLGHGLVLASLAGGTPDMREVKTSGDAALAGAVLAVLTRLSWDAEEDASRVLGDAAAHRLGRLVRRAFGLKGEIGGRLLEGWVEHLRDEAPLIAHRRDVERFVADVDALRDDAERLAKRLARLETAAGPSSTAKQGASCA